MIIKNIIHWLVGLLTLITLLITSTGLPLMVLIVIADLLTHPFELGTIIFTMTLLLITVVLLSITRFLVDLGKVTIKLFSSSIKYTMAKIKGTKK